MKKYNLLVEASDQIEVMTEQTEQGKNLYLEGIFAQANVINGNRRIYETKVMESAVDRYIREYVSKRRALGELNHPADRPFADPEHAAIRVVEMQMRGNDVYGKALVLNTPKGQIMKGLLEGGFALGVSTRGLGSIKEKNNTKYVQSDFMMTAVDGVDGPSAPNAFPNAIYENKQWMLNEATGNWVPILESEEDIKFNEQLFLEKLDQFIKNIKVKK